METLVCDSPSLRGNALQDPCVRYNQVMVPVRNGISKGFPVILVLSGFGGNGTYSVALNRSRDENNLQQIDNLVSKGKAPRAIYVFVDALTKLGGSQFLDSPATGKYESYIVNDLVPALKKYYPTSKSMENWCVMGASSGGYGAIHLVTKFPKLFSYAIALAPDSDFEICYGGDLLPAAQFINQCGGVRQAIKRLGDKSSQKNSKYHAISNAIAMSACYSAVSKKKILFPIEIKTGKLKSKVWKLWREKDPVEFIPKRRKNLKYIGGVYLAVGKHDEFFLYYGARKLSRHLRKFHVPLKYDEFNGGHFEMAIPRAKAYLWLTKKWS